MVVVVVVVVVMMVGATYASRMKERNRVEG